MVGKAASSNRPISRRPHVRIYEFILGLALLLVLSAWGFFGGKGYNGLVLGVVSVFVLISVMIPSVLWRIGRRRRQSEPTADRTVTFHDWMQGEFEIWQGHLRGKDAAIAILLPIAAVCIGLAAFAIELHLVTTGGL